MCIWNLSWNFRYGSVDPLVFTTGSCIKCWGCRHSLHLLNRSALRSVQAQARTPGFQKRTSFNILWGEVLTPIASSSVTHLSSSKQEEYVKVSIYHKLLGVTISYRVWNKAVLYAKMEDLVCALLQVAKTLFIDEAAKTLPKVPVPC